MKIDAEIKNLKNILANDEIFFQIPDYQRPYSWGKEQVSTLLDDLINAYLEDEKNEEQYFCGSIVLVENHLANRYDIIDGQQRITTFIILACVIRDIYKEKLNKLSKKYIYNSIRDEIEEDKEKLKFLTDISYQNEFIQTVLNGIDFFVKRKKSNKYLENAFVIKEVLEEKVKENNIDINDFIKWLYEKVVLTYISCPSEDTAIQIFNVLNDRGMPLSPVDILKSSLMHKIQGDNEKRKIFKREWDEIINNVNLMSGDVNIEEILTLYLYYKIEGNPKVRLDKALLKHFEKEKMDALDVVYEIKNFANTYHKLLNMQDRYIYLLKYLRHKSYWSSILTTALFVEYEDFDLLKELLVAYYYQNWIGGATRSRIKQTSFKIIKLVKQHKNIEEIKKEMKKNLDKYQTTKSFKDNLLYENVYDKSWIKPVLLLVEYFMDDAKYPVFQPINRELQVEHILPQKPSEYWKKIFSSEDIEEWKDKLGNLTLLRMRKNIQAGNDSFEFKKKIYAKQDNVITSFNITREILNYKIWNIKSLKDRHSKLINKIFDKLNKF